MRNGVCLSVTLLLVAVLTQSAAAGIVWDYSPANNGGSRGSEYSNSTGGQNFAEIVIFATDMSLSGMDIYCGTSYGSIGGTATIRLWTDSSGIPGSLLSSFTETVTAIDTVGATAGNSRKHVDFTNPITLTAGTPYWIGMSGTSPSLTQHTLITAPAGGNNAMAMFSGTTFSSNVGIGDMAFRLDGEAVPEPSTFALFGLGLIGSALVMKRRRSKKTAA
jgi:PEP-CTERM motif